MLHSRVFFGGSFHCSPISAHSCPPDVSACAGMVGSRGLSPKLSPLFRSEDDAKQLSPARRVRSSFVVAAFRPAFRFFACPTLCALCNKWVSGLARRRLIMPQSLRYKISRMNTCAKMVGGWGCAMPPHLASSASGPGNTLDALAPRNPSA